ncbi:TatD family hydrolase [Paenibacillus oenotherae]|uniref:TatD family hydrolase n=1 Tax=Paenibacillus oenotherae TaxID=1435645 RepID=A0ABS7D0E0_9BACL|nr:TatD family hydrolase [Paenibacillus oenotherae]MBW7473375.1 TatD family hydrolase [Paenibacillus oenotherae]
MESAKSRPRWVDAHLHVDLYDEAARERMLAEAFDDGVAAVVAVSMSLASSEVNRALSFRYEGRLLPAYGFHPEQSLPGERELNELFHWIDERIKNGEHCAIGEVGLPYYSRHEAKEKGQPFDERPYVQLLERFVRLAARCERPIVLHAVYEDADKACDLLEKHGVKRAHFHWFKGSPSTIKRMMEAGYYISITPDVLYEPEIQQLVKEYPLELMMTETDGPWPFEGPFSGQATRPAMVRDVAAAIAGLKGVAAEQAERKLLDNACTFYGLQGLNDGWSSRN